MHNQTSKGVHPLFPKQHGRCRGPGGFQGPHGVGNRWGTEVSPAFLTTPIEDSRLEPRVHPPSRLFPWFPKQRGRCRGPGGFQWRHWGWIRGRPPIFDHPYRRFATWPSNSLDKMAIQFRILDRGVDFWGPKSIIFECMQQNINFFIELRNVLREIINFVDCLIFFFFP